MTDLLEIVQKHADASKDISGQSFIFALGRMAQDLQHKMFVNDDGETPQSTEESDSLERS